MTFRINANSCKNAMGTVFLLATAFFVCSTFISMRSVLADPIVDTSAVMQQQKSGRQNPRNATNNRANAARTTASRSTASRARSTKASRAAVNRGTVGANKTVSSRGVTKRTTNTNTRTREVKSRSQSATRTTTNNNNAVRARTSASSSRVGVTGSVMAGSRAGTTTYSYLASKLYTGSYSNIIDSTTGLISADAYSNCMESYYTCMDEICTARSDTKGRCSCAGRATNFLAAEEALEKANEELITLSGQLSLLISTKGEGKDLAYAFSLTDAEKVMNCVSYKENVQTGKMTDADWYEKHPTVTDDNGNMQTSGKPKYCEKTGNTFGFDIKDIDGSSSDILSQLQAWADAKDLAKEYTISDSDNLLRSYTTVSSAISALQGVVNTGSDETASLDALANKWGYDLFQYAHNNVCGRVLDSCFNGIYEACGTPTTFTEGGKTVRMKCANGATSNCPFNYNSFISVDTDSGDVVLNDRSKNTTNVTSTASCFGYTTTTTSTGTRTTTTSSSDPYYSLRGPVADARRSIMQKYLLDANAACDTYGAALKQTAQNINYQKIAAEQALQAKRLEFRQEKEAKIASDLAAAQSNFADCIDEIWECYREYEEEDNWTNARIKAYCSQVSQVPHCYEPMVCLPQYSQLNAVIDLPDDAECKYYNDYDQNTCRNVVTISEILYGTGADAEKIAEIPDIPVNGEEYDSTALRGKCIENTVGNGEDSLRQWKKTVNYSIKYYDGNRELTNLAPAMYNTGDLPKEFDVSPTPTKEGFNFAGWCKDAALQDCALTITIPKGSASPKIFHAKWIAE